MGTTTWNQLPFAWLKVLEQTLSLPTSTQDIGHPSLGSSQASVLSWDHISYENQLCGMGLYSLYSFFFLDETPIIPGENVGLGKKTDLGNDRLEFSKAALWLLLGANCSLTNTSPTHRSALRPGKNLNSQQESGMVARTFNASREVEAKGFLSS